MSSAVPGTVCLTGSALQLSAAGVFRSAVHTAAFGGRRLLQHSALGRIGDIALQPNIQTAGTAGNDKRCNWREK